MLGFPTLNEQVEKLYEFSANPQQRVRTGLDAVDLLIGGPAPGEICMVVGRSFTGKSIVAQNIIWHNRHLHSIFFSLEMPQLLAIQRLYSIWSDTPQKEVQQMTEKGKLPLALREMVEDFPYHRIVDSEAITLDTMSLFLERYEQEYLRRPDFVVVDYLELVAGAKKRGEGWVGTEMQATGLKDWAKAENMRVFVLHQANKEENPWDPPTENSPRGGGFTEADFVVGMWNPSRDPGLSLGEYNVLKDKINFNVIKNRVFGEVTGWRHLTFQLKPSLRIEEVSAWL